MPIWSTKSLNSMFIERLVWDSNREHLGSFLFGAGNLS